MDLQLPPGRFEARASFRRTIHRGWLQDMGLRWFKRGKALVQAFWEKSGNTVWTWAFGIG